MIRRFGVPYPLGGVSELLAEDQQTFAAARGQYPTAADARNARGFDPVSGRLRGGQRAGSTAYLSASLAVVADGANFNAGVGADAAGQLVSAGFSPLPNQWAPQLNPFNPGEAFGGSDLSSLAMTVGFLPDYDATAVEAAARLLALGWLANYNGVYGGYPAAIMIDMDRFRPEASFIEFLVDEGESGFVDTSLGTGQSSYDAHREGAVLWIKAFCAGVQSAIAAVGATTMVGYWPSPCAYKSAAPLTQDWQDEIYQVRAAWDNVDVMLPVVYGRGGDLPGDTTGTVWAAHASAGVKAARRAQPTKPCSLLIRCVYPPNTGSGLDNTAVPVALHRAALIAARDAGASGVWVWEFQQTAAVQSSANALIPVIKEVFQQDAGASSSVTISDRVQHVHQLTYASRTSTYSAREDADDGPTVEWSRVQPNKRFTRNCVVDRAGNVYSITGDDRISKHNASGTLVPGWPLQPVFGRSGVKIRGLAVDDQDNLFFASYETPDGRVGRVWRYRPDGTGGVELAWTIDLDGECADIALWEDGGRLYVLENRDYERTAYLHAYANPDAATPDLRWTTNVPYPASQVQVNEDGDPVGCSLPASSRVPSLSPDVTISEEWTPADIAGPPDLRAHYDAKDLLSEGRTRGEQVTFWPDKSGNSRNLIDDDSDTAIALPPTFRPQVSDVQNLPGVRFTGVQALRGRAGQAFQPIPYESAGDENAITSFITLAVVAVDTAGWVYQVWPYNFGLIVGAERGTPDSYLTELAPDRLNSRAIYQAVLTEGPVNLGQASGSGEPMTFPYAGGRNYRRLKFGLLNDAPSGSGSGIEAPSLNVALAVCVYKREPTYFNSGRGFWRLNGRTVDVFQTTENVGESKNAESGIRMYFGGACLNDKGQNAGVGEGGGRRGDWSAWNHQGEDFEFGFGGHLMEFLCIEGVNSRGNPIDALDVGWGSGEAPSGSGSGAGVQIDLVKMLEGYAAHRWGIQSLLPSGHPYKAAPPPKPGSGSASASGSGSGEVVNAVFAEPTGIVYKLDRSDGSVVWAYTNSGVGYALALDAEGGVYNVGIPTEPTSGSGSAAASGSAAGSGSGGGPQSGGGQFEYQGGGQSGNIEWGVPGVNGERTVGAGELFTVRKITDQGETVDDMGSNGWVRQLDHWTDPWIRLAVDPERNLYLPAYHRDGHPTLYKLTSTGALEWWFVAGFGSGSGAAPTGSGSASGSGASIPATVDGNRGLCCALSREDTDFGSGIGERRFLYVGTDQATTNSDRPSLWKLGLVDVQIDQGPPRSTAVVAVVRGDVIRVTPGQLPESAIVDGGAIALGAATEFIDAAEINQRLYYTDGNSYKVYDPVRNAVSDWSAAGSGSIPEGARLCVRWANRAVLARFADDPQNWAMSAIGDPTDWDFFPQTPTSTQAVIGNDTRAGATPDLVNALIPLTDDLLIIGGDKTIQMIAGNPAALGRPDRTGGVMDLVTDEVGIAFGRAWCQSPEGVVYFVSTEGFCYEYVPAAGAKPTMLSVPIPERLRDGIDFSKVRPELEWDHRQKGFILSLFPLPDTAEQTIEHWFYEAPNGAWWPDQYGAWDLQPTACARLNGDTASDRGVLLGDRTGRLRTVDMDATNDITTAIDSRVLIGPVEPQAGTRRARLVELDAVLASGQGGASVRVYDGQTSDVRVERQTLTVPAGRSRVLRPRARGTSLWLELINANAGERWAFERLNIGVADAGVDRKR